MATRWAAGPPGGDGDVQPPPAANRSFTQVGSSGSGQREQGGPGAQERFCWLTSEATEPGAVAFAWGTAGIGAALMAAPSRFPSCLAAPQLDSGERGVEWSWRPPGVLEREAPHFGGSWGGREREEKAGREKVLLLLLCVRPSSFHGLGVAPAPSAFRPGRGVRRKHNTHTHTELSPSPPLVLWGCQHENSSLTPALEESVGGVWGGVEKEPPCAYLSPINPLGKSSPPTRLPRSPFSPPSLCPIDLIGGEREGEGGAALPCSVFF